MSNTNANATSTNVVMPLETRPKRGIKPVTMEIKDTTIPHKAHHQKTLILELLKDGPMSLEEMVKMVESSDEMKLRLKSKQSVFNCITYHMKDLKNIGIIEVK